MAVGSKTDIQRRNKMIYLFSAISFITNIVLGYFFIKSAKKLIEFDMLFDSIADDLEDGITFFNEVLRRPAFINSPEMNVISRNINVLRDKMMVNANNIALLKQREKSLPKNYQPPVVVD